MEAPSTSSSKCQPEPEFSHSYFNQTAKFIDRHIYWIRYVSCGLAATGVYLIARNIYLVKKFASVADLPARYISSHVRLQGVVRQVNEGGLLSVDHTPIVSGKWLAKRQGDGHLPVRVACAELSPEGVQWLRDNLQDQQIWFRLLHVNTEQHVECLVRFKQTWYRRPVDVSRTLIQGGLATFQHAGPDFHQVPLYQRLSRQLILAEVRAERKGRGVWIRPSRWQRMRAWPGRVGESVADAFRIKKDALRKRFWKDPDPKKE